MRELRLIMKFGGTSVADGDRIESVSKIVQKESAKNEIVVVTSAMDSTTDYLIELAERANRGEIADDSIKNIQENHEAAIRKAIPNLEIQKRVLEDVLELISQLRNAITGVSILKELTPRSSDHITSFGERLVAPILAGALENIGLRANHLTGGEAGILTDDVFGEATPLMKSTKQMVRNVLNPLLDDEVIPVITGFIGVTQQGEISTIGRGGSDYTATILGSCLDADEIWIWSDVDGLMTADPRIVSQAKVITELSYAETSEMALMGAKGMHPRALEPAKHNSIPIKMKNSFNTSASGTMISKEIRVHNSEVAKAVASIKDLAMIGISGMSMVGKPGMAAEIFGILGRNGINLSLIHI